jgi:hypothetical protein
MVFLEVFDTHETKVPAKALTVESFTWTHATLVLSAATELLSSAERSPAAVVDSRARAQPVASAANPIPQ